MARLERTSYPGFQRKDGETHERWDERTQGLLDDLEKASSKKDPRVNPLAGALVRFQVADGYAFYVVTREEPLTLQHVPFLDGYQANEATVRGVNKNTVRTQLLQQRSLAEMFNRGDGFYASLRLGQVVHYHSGFGAFYRCEVVRGKTPHGPGVQNCLKPVALVGNWRTYELPKRMPDGSVHLGHAAKSVSDGDLMTPHHSSVFESPEYAYKGNAELPDPTALPPVSLEVPGMTDAEEQKASLWRQVARIRSLMNDRLEEDPSCILRAVSEAVHP